MARSHSAVHRTILVVDIERFGSPVRSDRDRVVVRTGLYRALAAALMTVSVAMTDCDHHNSGDGVLVVLPPSIPESVLVDALPGKLIAELRAHNEDHEPAQRIRLRMALHAGEIRYDEHGVVGTAINHAFRLLDAPLFKTAFARSGGPLGVIVSAWFFDEVVQHSGDGPAAYRRIRVVAKETDTYAWMYLPDGAPATTTPPPGTAPCQLPPTNRLFVGREAELRRLAVTLDQHDAPTVVITAIAGTAGIGKTTLATWWANSVRDRFPDGQLHVDLRGFDSRTQLDPAQVLHGFLEALGVNASAIPGDLGARSAMFRGLAARRTLLVLLDNARSADQVRPLLPNSPTCLVLITSRNRLDSLVVRDGAHRVELELLPFDDAVRVLTGRMRPHLVRAEPDAVADLVRYCAGLPLALSIVAARAVNQPGLSLQQLAEQLRDEHERLDLLDLGEDDLNIRAVLSWSYQTLSAPAARLFRLLGVHPGPDVDRLACAVLVEDDRVGPLLTELTAAHLLEEHQPGRYRFHDLLRVYARECAERDEPDLECVTARMVGFYVAAVNEADHHIQPWREGNLRAVPRPVTLPAVLDSRAAMTWLARENATLLAMVDFAARHRLGDQAGRMAWAFNTFLVRSGQLHERVAVHRTAVEVATDDGGRLTALTSLARGLARSGQFADAKPLLDQAADLVARMDLVRTGDHRAVVLQLAYVAVYEQQERYVEALFHAEQALAMVDGGTNAHLRADGVAAVARQLTWLGEAASALPMCEQVLALYREIAHVEGEAMILTTYGYAHRRLGRYRQAIEYFEQALLLDRELESRYWEAHALDQIGDLYALLGEPATAMVNWRQAADTLDQLHHHEGVRVHAKLDEAAGTRLP